MREYIYFVCDMWKSQDKWISLINDSYDLEPLARNYFWQVHQNYILDGIREYQQQGYEVEGEIGSVSIKLHRTEQVETNLNFVDVILWIMTFGLFLLVQLWLGHERRYAVFTAVEFRVKLYLPISETPFLHSAPNTDVLDEGKYTVARRM